MAAIEPGLGGSTEYVNSGYFLVGGLRASGDSAGYRVIWCGNMMRW